LRITGGPGIDCVTLREGPPGIESQSDADAVIAPLCPAIRDAERERAAFVIACFSDPGLFSIDVGRQLRDHHGADVLVMGCAGMAGYRGDLEEAVQIPVVEPTQAAVAMAIVRIRLGWGQSLR
jgi:Asp/Glu/hydantoin racemase